MKLYDLIKSTAGEIKDREMEVVSPLEWLEIFNTQRTNLWPDAYYNSYKEILPTVISDSYIIDMSDQSGIRTVTDVLLQLSSGNQVPTDNWRYDKDLKRLYLDPNTMAEIVYDVRSATSIIIKWRGVHPEFLDLADTILLDEESTELLKFYAKKDFIKRVMYDKTKLDRYRALTGDENLYTLLALERQENLEIELQKRKTRQADIGTF
jgi:hypothetical protein